MAEGNVFQEIEDYAEKKIEEMITEIGQRFEAEVQRRLDDWGARYPRHRFEAYQGHGMLKVRISPPLGPDKRREWMDLEDVSSKLRRGEIAVLYEEVRELVDAHVRLEWRVSTPEFGPLTSPAADENDDEPYVGPHGLR